MNRTLRIGLKILSAGVFSVVGALFSGPWGPCGPSSPAGLVFMLGAFLCIPSGGLVSLAGIVLLLWRKKSAPQTV